MWVREMLFVHIEGTCAVLIEKMSCAYVCVRVCVWVVL